jgi:hypothetical protein
VNTYRIGDKVLVEAKVVSEYGASPENRGTIKEQLLHEEVKRLSKENEELKEKLKVAEEGFHALTIPMGFDLHDAATKGFRDAARIYLTKIGGAHETKT